MSVFTHSVGRRARINNPKLEEYFNQHNLGKIIFTVFDGNDGRDYNFYPLLTDEDKRVLNTKVLPENGYKIVVQGEFTIAKEKDHLKIGTFSIDSCRGFLIYDPINRIAAVGHCDFKAEDLSVTEAMKRALIRDGADPNNLMFIGTPNIEKDYQRMLGKSFKEVRFDLPTDFAFDLSSLAIEPFEVKSIPDTNNAQIRLNNKTDVRLKHHIPWIES